jgi:hypothetical protein
MMMMNTENEEEKLVREAIERRNRIKQARIQKARRAKKFAEESARRLDIYCSKTDKVPTLCEDVWKIIKEFNGWYGFRLEKLGVDKLVSVLKRFNLRVQNLNFCRTDEKRELLLKGIYKCLRQPKYIMQENYDYILSLCVRKKPVANVLPPVNIGEELLIHEPYAYQMWYGVVLKVNKVSITIGLYDYELIEDMEYRTTDKMYGCDKYIWKKNVIRKKVVLQKGFILKSSLKPDDFLLRFFTVGEHDLYRMR